MFSRRNYAQMALLATMCAATPAMADPITLDTDDIGTSVTVNYDGILNGSEVSGLSAVASFTLTDIQSRQIDDILQHIYSFDFSAANTSTSFNDSLISSIAFNFDPSISAAGITTNLNAEGISVYNTFASTRIYTSYPNGIGPVDVCFGSGPVDGCNSDNGGIATGDISLGSFDLRFYGPVMPITFEDFFIRYHSLAGTGSDGAANGTGTITSISSSGTPIPAPGMTALFGFAFALIVVFRRRRSVQPKAS